MPKHVERQFEIATTHVAMTADGSSATLVLTDVHGPVTLRMSRQAIQNLAEQISHALAHQAPRAPQP